MSSEVEQQRELSVGEALELAIQAHRTGQFDAAAEIYRRVLEAWPDCPDALHFSGLLAFTKGDPERAVILIEKSLLLAPEHPDFWNNFGNVLKAQGKKSEATAAYHRAIDLRPDFADAHNNLGVMASQQGDFSSAVEAYQKAITFQSTHADAHLNLGNAFDRLELKEEAAAAYKATIALRPGHPEAYGRLGQIFWRQGKMHEATEAIVRNTEVNPGDPMAFILLASIFFQQGQIEGSIEAYRKAVEIEPKNSFSNRLLGLSLVRCGRPEEAKEVWRKWAAADPENPVPRHLILAGTDDQIPSRAGDDFVVREFDRFAESFDEKLKSLEYRAPELVAEALRGFAPDAARALDILDAGCGTGLCGPLLRPFARRLEGVDLSKGMLDKAKARGGYDDLVMGELTTFISAKKEAYDVIVSADTLCYFGRLDEVFSAVATALRRGGYFIFTLERTADATGTANVTLDHSGRYTHTEEYVRSGISHAGLAVENLSFTALRLEYFKPVEGMVIVARKLAKTAT